MSYLWKQVIIVNVGWMPIANCNFLEAATFIPFLWDKRNQSWKDFFPLLSQRKKERILPLLKSCIQLHLCRLLIDQHSCFCSQTFRRFNEFALKGSSLTFLLHHSRSYFLLNRIFLGLNLFWESKFECQVPIVFQSCTFFTGRLKKKKPGQFQIRDIWKPHLISTTRVTTIAKDCCFFMRHSYEFSGILKINSKRKFYRTPDSSERYSQYTTADQNSKAVTHPGTETLCYLKVLSNQAAKVCSPVFSTAGSWPKDPGFDSSYLQTFSREPADPNSAHSERILLYSPIVAPNWQKFTFKII